MQLMHVFALIVFKVVKVWISSAQKKLITANSLIESLKRGWWIKAYNPFQVSDGSLPGCTGRIHCFQRLKHFFHLMDCVHPMEVRFLKRYWLHYTQAAQEVRRLLTKAGFEGP